MHIALLAEDATGERRVGLTPIAIAKLVASGHSVTVEPGAGRAAGFLDDQYRSAGARVVDDLAAALAEADAVVQVRGPGTHQSASRESGGISHLGSRNTYIALLDPLWRPDRATRLASTGASLLALELVPRITRAQSMDVLSSMATVAGYEAVLLAARQAPRMFPMLMTAAGTVPPARVFVLGAGVAGLQAIATAKRLGAVVHAYDVRPAAAEQIESVGGRAVTLDLATSDAEDAGGYARAQSDDQNARQQELLTPLLAESDVVITTAAIPGRASPELITASMVEQMAAGSVIVDLAAERGGNCALTQADIELDHQGVLILGPTDLASHSASTASQMFATNVVTLLDHLTDERGDLVLDRDDDITAAMLVAIGGEIVHPLVTDALTASGANV